jgi:hypothetical protein
MIVYIYNLYIQYSFYMDAEMNHWKLFEVQLFIKTLLFYYFFSLLSKLQAECPRINSLKTGVQPVFI